MMLATRGLGSPSPGISAFGFGSFTSEAEPPAPVRRRLGSKQRRPPPLISAGGSLAPHIVSRSEVLARTNAQGSTEPAVASHSFCSVVTAAWAETVAAVVCAGQLNALTLALSEAQGRPYCSGSTETTASAESVANAAPRVAVDVCAVVSCEGGAVTATSSLAAMEAGAWASCEARSARVAVRGAARYPWTELRSEHENDVVLSARTALPIQLDARTRQATSLQPPLVGVELRAQPLQPVAIDAHIIRPLELRMREQGIRLDVTWKRRP